MSFSRLKKNMDESKNELNVIQSCFKTRDGRTVSITIQIESSEANEKTSKENFCLEEKKSPDSGAKEKDYKDKDSKKQKNDYMKERSINPCQAMPVCSNKNNPNTPKDHRPGCPLSFENLNAAAATPDVKERNLHTEEETLTAIEPCEETSDGQIDSVSNEIIDDAQLVTENVDDEDDDDEEEDKEEDVPLAINIFQKIKNLF